MLLTEMGWRVACGCPGGRGRAVASVVPRSPVSFVALSGVCSLVVLVVLLPVVLSLSCVRTQKLKTQSFKKSRWPNDPRDTRKQQTRQTKLTSQQTSVDHALSFAWLSLPFSWSFPR